MKRRGRKPFALVLRLAAPAAADTAAFSAWKQFAHLSLGADEDGGRSFAILFLPIQKGSGWKARRALLDTPALARDMTDRPVVVRGLPALERIL